MMEFKNLKIGDRIDKKELGSLGFFKENPRVVKISYQFYDDKTGISETLSVMSKDYDDLFEEDEDDN